MKKLSKHCAELATGHKIEFQILVHPPKDECTMDWNEACEATQKLVKNLMLDVLCELTDIKEMF